MSAISRWLDMPAFQWGATAVFCLAGGLLAYAVIDAPAAPALFWPPTGVALGAAGLWGWRAVPAAVLGTFLAVLAQDTAWVEAAWLGLAVGAQAALGRPLLARSGLTKACRRINDLFRLLLFGGLLPALAALPFAYMGMRDAEAFWELPLALQLLTLMLGSLVSVLVFSTLMLCWRDRRPFVPYARRAEIVLVLLALVLATVMVIRPEAVGLPSAPLRPYPLLPFLLWLALRADVRLVALALAWIGVVVAGNSAWGTWALQSHPVGQWVWPLHGFLAVVGASFLILAMLVERNRRLEQVRLAEALAQRDALVREVHHRIKNNLQTVVSLLRRDAAKHPEIAPLLETAINQVQSIAVVHGLQGRVNPGAVTVCDLLPAICRSITELSGTPIAVTGVEKGCGELRVHDNETVALALVINELVSNAVKHMAGDARADGPSVALHKEDGKGRVRIRNPGVLPPGFDFAQGCGCGTGLGLVRALLPNPGVVVEMRQEGGEVVVEMQIGAPVLAAEDSTGWRKHEKRAAG